MAHMKIEILTLIALLFLTNVTAFNDKSISVTDFGAYPNDGKNDIQALNKAINFSRSNPGTILKFAPGIYDIADKNAIKLMNDILTGKIQGNSQDSIFKPYYPYTIGLDFNGTSDLTIEGNGAILLIDGWMEPISLKNCKNITITGLTIDYKRQPKLEGEITRVNKGSFTVVLNNEVQLHTKMPLNRILYIDDESGRIMDREDYFPKFQIVDARTLEINKSLDHEYVNKRVMIPQTFHFRPAILILESSDIELGEITIHSQPGMGIVGHRSENILMKGVRIIPASGDRMSTNTDATHFTSCKGFLKYINCQFEGHGDDAANIHNYYLEVSENNKPKSYTLNLNGADWHAGYLDYPDVGDQMELVKKSTLEVVRNVRVEMVQNDIPNLSTTISIDQELPKNLEDYYLINSTRLPSVEIIGCTVRSNRARGFLIKTRNVLIEYNDIRNSTGTGIHIGAEGYWHEGPASENVRIRYNRILNTGTGAGTIDNTCGIAVSVQADNSNVSGLHKKILIEGNIIKGLDSEHGISVLGAKDVVIRYNQITGCKKPINIKSSNQIEIYANYIDAQYKK